jgi:hypothetical protein
MDQITTYATLQSAVAGMIHRASSATITDNVPLFIQLCEADLNDRLLLKDMESDEPLTLTTSQNYVALPTGFVSPIAFWLVVDGQREPLDFVLPQQLPYDTDDNQPQFVAVDGANLRFDCPADSGYSAFLRCIKKSNLSVSTTTNALLLKRPDVYLFGTLHQVSLFTKDDNEAQKYFAKYENAISGLKSAEARARNMVPMRVDPALAGRGGDGFNVFNG